MTKRYHKGTANPNSKLSWTAVTRIRKCRNLPVAKLAEEYGVSRSTIYNVRLGRIWPESARPGKRRKAEQVAS